MKKGSWKNALADHKPLLCVAAAYCVSALLLALWCGVEPSNLLHIFGFIGTTLAIALIFLTGMYLGSFLQFFFSGSGGVSLRWEQAGKKLDIASRGYLEGDRWAYACLAFAVTLSDNFFFIAKSMIPIVNPYASMKWDVVFASLDKTIHFGRYPHEFLIPLVNGAGAEYMLDAAYALWLVVMFLVVGYNVFMDDRLHRRLRFLWTYLLAWVLLGSVAAMMFSSVGPLFFHDFLPKSPNPYTGLVKNFDQIAKDSFLFAAKTRHLLLEWAHNDRKFDPNTLSAMPSMHIAIAWLLVLYAREISRVVFAAAAVFAGSIFLGSVYLGFHYAIDAYVSVICVTLIWWLVGKFLDRRHARDVKLQGMA